MKKNGWGLRMELVFILMFLICLVIAVIGLNRLGFLGNSDNSLINQSEDNSFSYSNLESKVVTSAKKYYVNEYNDDILLENTIIRVSTLYYNGYIEKLYDKNNKQCSGYVELVPNGDNIVYVPYIKCPKYKTRGYDGSNDW
ncbi:MAG: hypothetical protein GX758_00860 [Tenericutes bacterium]|nr:hypothetical protein [Mycoplasmatota bacterium]